MSAHDNELDLFEDPDAPPTPEELAAAAALVSALEAPASMHGDALLAAALRAAHTPADLPASQHDRLVAQAIEHARPSKALPPSNVLAFRRKVYAAVSIFAAAACLALVLGHVRERAYDEDAPRAASVAAMAPQQVTPEEQTLALRRSTQGLFAEPFAKEGGSSARIDTIALARSKDLRENRFARWGVR